MLVIDTTMLFGCTLDQYYVDLCMFIHIIMLHTRSSVTGVFLHIIKHTVCILLNMHTVCAYLIKYARSVCIFNVCILLNTPHWLHMLLL